MRISGVSVCDAYDFEEKWIKEWGYWRTITQYITYVQGKAKGDSRPAYGRSAFVGGIFDFALGLQAGRPFDFVPQRRVDGAGGAPRTGSGPGGLRGAGNFQHAGVLLRLAGHRR